MQNEVAVPANHLTTLAIATTRYHEATPDRIEYARMEYEEALYQFKSAQAGSEPEVGSFTTQPHDSGPATHSPGIAAY